MCRRGKGKCMGREGKGRAAGQIMAGVKKGTTTLQLESLGALIFSTTAAIKSYKMVVEMVSVLVFLFLHFGLSMLVFFAFFLVFVFKLNSFLNEINDNFINISSTLCWPLIIITNEYSSNAKILLKPMQL